MASLNQPQDEEQKQQAGAPVQTSNGGGASSGGTGAGATTSPVAQNSPQQQQGFTDVSSYLSANQGGSADLGNRVAGNLTQKYNDTKSSIDQSAASANSSINNGYVKENTDLIKQVASNPVQAAQTPSNASAVQAQLSDTYKGPTGWEDFGTQQGKVNDATSYGSLATTPGGLNVYAQQAEGQTGGNQSAGINQLDTLLLGGSPSAMGRVQAAADPYKGLNDYINSQNTAVGNNVTAAQTAANTARNDAQAALLGPTGATGQLDAQLQSQLSTALQNGQTSNADILQSVKTGNFGALIDAGILTRDQALSLRAAISQAGHGGYVQNRNSGALIPTASIDTTGDLTQQNPDTVYNINNTATADEAARSRAFEQLLGSNNYTSKITDPSQAGTAPTAKDLNVFDYLDANGRATTYNKDALAYAQAQAQNEQNQADAEHNAEKQHTFGGHLKQFGKDVAAGFANPLLLVPKEIHEAEKDVKKI